VVCIFCNDDVWSQRLGAAGACDGRGLMDSRKADVLLGVTVTSIAGNDEDHAHIYHEDCSAVRWWLRLL
jgi:hypothetical protein